MQVKSDIHVKREHDNFQNSSYAQWKITRY